MHPTCNTIQDTNIPRDFLSLSLSISLVVHLFFYSYDKNLLSFLVKSFSIRIEFSVYTIFKNIIIYNEGSMKTKKIEEKKDKQITRSTKQFPFSYSCSFD